MALNVGAESVRVPVDGAQGLLLKSDDRVLVADDVVQLPPDSVAVVDLG